MDDTALWSNHHRSTSTHKMYHENETSHVPKRITIRVVLSFVGEVVGASASFARCRPPVVDPSAFQPNDNRLDAQKTSLIFVLVLGLGRYYSDDDDKDDDSRRRCLFGVAATF
jgi:hypothetical protein